MSASSNHREFIPEKTNPVDRIREGTNRGVWNRAGEVLHTIVDNTGAFLSKGAEIGETGMHHGGRILGGIARIAGTAAGSAVDIVEGFGQNFKNARRSGSDGHSKK